MASIVNSTKSYANKFYSDIPELRSSTMNDLEYRDDVDLANMSSVPDITSDQGMLGPELEGAVKEVVKSNLSPIKRATTRTYDWKTKNKSFLSLFKDLNWVLDPKYVGNKLQYQMLNELDKYSIDKNYNFVVATIHPDNIYSINNFIKDNFKQTSTKEFKRGLRNIYVKELIK